MRIHDLPKITASKKKRLGRGLGSGVGAKSTRGGKRHQKAREKIKPGFEGGQGRIIKKFPLLRGKGKNKPPRKKPLTVTIGRLEKLAPGSTVDVVSLVKEGVVDEKALKSGVKLVAGGELTTSLKVAIPCSKGAQEQIALAGGSILM
ncbi:MAG: 50S ribosomal protein L15 [Candidatus Paceibacterota bacterium]